MSLIKSLSQHFLSFELFVCVRVYVRAAGVGVVGGCTSLRCCCLNLLRGRDNEKFLGILPKVRLAVMQRKKVNAIENTNKIGKTEKNSYAKMQYNAERSNIYPSSRQFMP